MKNLPIRIQILFIAVLAVVGIIATAAIYLGSNQKLQSAIIEEEQAVESLLITEEIKYYFLNARRDEKDFLIRLNNKYAVKHQKTVSKVKHELNELKLIHDEPKLQKEIAAIEKDFSSYVAKFASVRENWQKAGLTPKEGLRGELRKAVHAVETKLKEFHSPKLEVTMLMMRRHEKDFLMRVSPKYVESMIKRRTDFTKQLEISLLPENIRENMLQAMDRYHVKFNALANLRLRLVGDVKELSRLFAIASPKLEKLVTYSIEEKETAKQVASETITSTIKTMLSSMVIIAIIVGLMSALIGRKISGAINQITSAMKRLANRELEVDIPAKQLKNEIGEMANALQVFKDNAIEMNRLEIEQKELGIRAEKEKKHVMNQMADEFEANVGGIVASVSSSSVQLQSTANVMSSASENATAKATNVATASNQASANVQTVATAAEELAASICEISRQVDQSSRVAENAVISVRETNTQINGLSEAADRIGDAVNMITAIADQTNLLALNATIEAARAGDAGKGFAVVASEVKNLADQTAQATQEISRQVNGVQFATKEAIGAIATIGNVIGEMNEIAAVIATAVEEQGAATQEISRNVQEAANGTEEVNNNIGGVTEAAQETGAASAQVLSSAEQLSAQSEDLKTQVEKFISQVRVA